MRRTIAKTTAPLIAGALAVFGSADAAAQSRTPAAPSAAPAPSTSDHIEVPPPAVKILQEQWNGRFRRARIEQDRGHTGYAYELFLRLADDALSDADRRLAREMADSCRAQLERAYGPRIVLSPNAPAVRTSEELSVLYARGEATV